MATATDTGEALTVAVVGSGPAGLATAAELARRGVAATVLERGERLGAAWAGRHDSLRFNTSRAHSALPGAPFPRDWGQFPTRDQYVGYLEQYAAERAVVVRTDTEVRGLERDAAGWRLATADGALRARHVVIATGIMNRPRMPDWGEVSAFPGRVLHSAAYRSPADFAGADVLVVGTGSSGMEVAAELSRDGARRVWLSCRTSSHVIPREVGGRPTDLPMPLLLHLPTRVVDALLVRMARRIVGDLSLHGLPTPQEGPIRQLRARGTGTAIVDDWVVDQVRSRALTVVPALERLDGDGALLADGRHLQPDAVIAATGYRTGLEQLVGHLGVLDARGMPLEPTGREAAPGLRFVGYVFRPGLTGYCGRLARRAASGIAARERASRRARRGSTPPSSPGPTSRGLAASPG